MQALLTATNLSELNTVHVLHTSYDTRQSLFSTLYLE